MKTIVIPGYSTKNKEWAYKVKDSLKKLDILVYEWKHWNDPTVKFSPQNEAKDIKELAGDSEVNIIVKSIGTYVTMLAISREKMKVNKLILNGVCLNDLNENEQSEYKIVSDMNPEKVIVFQNSLDEHGSFEEVRRFLTGYNPNIKIIEKPGSTHDYPYYDEFEEFLI